MTHKPGHNYSFLLAAAGLSVTFMFMLLAASFIWGSVYLIGVVGGFWGFVGGAALWIPSAWAAFLGAGVAERTVVNQR